MFPVPYGMAGVGGMLPLDAAASIPQPMPITALASALANASSDQQRTMLGDNLYPLVDQLEHEHAAKDYESQQLLNDFTCYSVSDIAFEKWHIGLVSDITFEIRLFDLYGLQGTFSTGVFLYFFVLFKG
ncbi:putative polyadenylate-binding protein/Hyperplastic disc protein [Helianthus anomalus]